LRLNEKLRQTLSAYRETVEPAADGGAADDNEPSPDTAQQRDLGGESLPQTIAELHHRAAIDALRPRELDPIQFLKALIINDTVPDRARRRAAKLLSKRQKARQDFCICESATVARDRFEFREWVDELTEAGLSPVRDDAGLARIVESIARGENLEPWPNYRRTWNAVRAVILDSQMPDEESTDSDAARTREDDPAIAPFWKAILSADKNVSPTKRLDAFTALDDFGVFPGCTCNPPEMPQLVEQRIDAIRASAIRLLTRRTYAGAAAVVRFPETYLAIREGIDRARAVSHRPAAAE
jgi:hypothetical protein